MSKIVTSLILKGARFILYCGIAFAAIYLVQQSQKQSLYHTEAETLFVTQQRIYMLAIDKIDPEKPEFNVYRPRLMQRIYDLQQREVPSPRNLSAMLNKIYLLDSVLDRVYFYNPAQDLSGTDRSVIAARARAAIDGLSEVEQRLGQALSVTELDQFKIQLEVVKTSLTDLTSSGGGSTALIDRLSHDYNVLVDLAWDTELTPLVSDSGRQEFNQVTEWLTAR